MSMIIELPKEGFKPIVQYGNLAVYAFYFNVEETENDTIVCNEVTLTIPKATYETMVAKLIEVKYSIDAQLALLYNYQADNETYADAMSEYQAWRTYCKESAREFFGIEEDTL